MNCVKISNETKLLKESETIESNLTKLQKNDQPYKDLEFLPFQFREVSVVAIVALTIISLSGKCSNHRIDL